MLTSFLKILSICFFRSFHTCITGHGVVPSDVSAMEASMGDTRSHGRNPENNHWSGLTAINNNNHGHAELFGTRWPPRQRKPF